MKERQNCFNAILFHDILEANNLVIQSTCKLNLIICEFWELCVLLHSTSVVCFVFMTK